MNVLLGRYVCNEWLKYMGITLVATFALLVFEDMYREFPALLNHGTGAILRHYLHFFPRFFCTVLPVSVFISALMSLCYLRNNNEFIAMQGAGLTPWQITKNMWVWSLVLSALMMLLQAHLGEWSRDKNRYDVSYQDGKSGRLWLISRLNAKNGCAEDLFVLDPGPPMRRFHAQNAYWDGCHWNFKGVGEFTLAISEKDGGHGFWGEKIFDEFHETPCQIMSQQKRPKDMCLRELRHALHWGPEKSPSSRAYRVRFYAIYVACLGPFIALFCAIPFSMRGMRQNPAIGTAKAIGLLFLFHVLTGLSHSMGNNGIIPPMAAAGLPFLMPVFIGILCLRR
jgi:lipopolysaccharide export system permease protein